MKKLIILILLCVASGSFAQVSQDAHIDIAYPKVHGEIAFVESNNAVLTPVASAAAYDQRVFSSKTFMNAHTGKIATNEKVLIKRSFMEDNASLKREGMLTFSKDKKTVFFSVNRKFKKVKSVNGGVIETKRAVNLQLFKASVDEKGDWVDLEMLPFNSTRYSTGQPYLNADNTKLYFVSDSPESLGRTDIFVVDLNEDGTYGSPKNLGPKINSSEREIFPFIDKKNVLYFSSDVQNNKGDLDVFASRVFDNSISVPVKLEGNVAVDKSDIVYDIYENEELNSFSFKEQSSKGVEHIYAAIDASKININCQQEISGIVKNADTQELLSNVKMKLYDGSEEVLSSFQSNESDASFSFKQSCNTSYTLKGYLDGYLIGEIAIKTINDLDAEPLEIVMHMKVDKSKENVVVTNRSLETVNETVQVTKLSEDAKLGSNYNFESEQEVYTVQLGAFQGKAATNKYIELSSLFNYQYEDGLNRYFSGVFQSRPEAMNYLNLLKMNGFDDAFVVGLKGGKRF